jgi:hypothetical protein
MKSPLKGTHFQSVDEVKSKTADLVDRVSAVDLQHFFEQQNICMQWCTDGGESMLKGNEYHTTFLLISKLHNFPGSQLMYISWYNFQ